MLREDPGYPSVPASPVRYTRDSSASVDRVTRASATNGRIGTNPVSRLSTIRFRLKADLSPRLAIDAAYTR